MKEAIAKLEIIRELALESSVKQVCDVMIDVLKKQDKKEIGFKNDES